MALRDTVNRILGRRDPGRTNGLVLAEGSSTRKVIFSGNQTVLYETLYETQPVVAAVVNKLVRQISTLPIEVCRHGADGAVEKVNDDHELVRLLRNPAPRYGSHSLGQWIALPVLVHGNSLLVKARDPRTGRPYGILPVDWRYTNAYAPMGMPINLWSTIQTGEELWIDPSEAMHFAWQGTRGWLGVSPLAQLHETLRLEDSAKRYQVSNFDKGVRPSGALVLEKDIDPESPQGKRIRDALRKLNEGVDNAGRVMLVGGGADFKPFSMTAVEAELISQRKLNREEVEIAYDVPPPVIGDLEHGTYSNVEELHRQLYKTTLRPWLQMIADTINAQLIQPEPEWQGLYCRFDLSDVLRGDPAAEMEAIGSLVEGGVIDRNEARKKLGMNPRPEAEASKLFIPANNQQQIDQTGDTETSGGNTLPAPPYSAGS